MLHTGRCGPVLRFGFHVLGGAHRKLMAGDLLLRLKLNPGLGPGPGGQPAQLHAHGHTPPNDME